MRKALMAFLAGCMLPGTGALAEPLGTPPSVAQLEVARRLKRDENLPQAILVLGEVVRREPDFFKAQRRLGEYLVEQGRHAEAIAHLEQAVRIHEKEKVGDNGIYNSLGWAYLLHGDYHRSEQALLKARDARAPLDQRVKVQNNLGYLYMTTGQVEKSRKAFSEAAPNDRSGFAEEQLKSLDRYEQLRQQRK